MERDLIKMILHLRKMIPHPKYDEKILKDFREIFRLFPEGVIDEKIINDITGPL